MLSSVIARGPWGPGGGGRGFGPLSLLGPAIALTLLILIAAFVVLAFFAARRRGSWGRAQMMARAGMGRPSSAETILAERFARGEIDEQQYVHRRSVLRGETAAAPPAAAPPPPPAPEPTNLDKTERIPPAES
ncbi:hypothetical protein GCM10009765_50760 [Fodinicola feengrottensis]|uniref:SHOCT domain-containing protein n=1 Tax=Fodinicola feengrottensis TaxID=435914 RepID=A0ABN2HXY1_9ACTN